MIKDNTYEGVMSRRGEIMKKAVGIDYEEFESGTIAFDFERMMKETGYDLQEIEKIQNETGVGNTPIKNQSDISTIYIVIRSPGTCSFVFDRA